MRRLSLCISISALALLAACGGSSATDYSKNTTSTNLLTSTDDVYVAGAEAEGSDTQATYWFNGNATHLGSGIATGIALNQGKVVVSGFGDQNGVIHAIQWIDGTSTLLPAPDPNVPAKTTSFAYGTATANGKVYTVGQYGKQAVLWTDGVPLLLSGATESCAYTVSVSGNTVYAGGYFIDGSGKEVAAVWQSGATLPYLSDGTLSTEVHGIGLKGSDVVCAGFKLLGDGNNNAVSWVNQQSTSLSANSASNLNAYALAVSNGDVYAAGQADDKGVIWKNGSLFFTTADASRKGVIRGLAIRSTTQGDVVYATGAYTSGSGVNTSSNAIYWKNGIETQLSKSDSEAYAICVVPH